MLEKLKLTRERKGFTQEEVAKFLQVDRSTYTGWETGKDMIPLPKLNDLANLYHTSLDFLIGKSPSLEEVKHTQIISTSFVANHLKEFRRLHHLSQKKLADRITTSQPNIHKYENEKCLITTYYALEFCKQFDYSLDDLVGRSKEKIRK